MLNSIKYLGVICNLTYYFELSVSTKSKLALHMSIEYSATDYFMFLRQNEELVRCIYTALIGLCSDVVCMRVIIIAHGAVKPG